MKKIKTTRPSAARIVYVEHYFWQAACGVRESWARKLCFQHLTAARFFISVQLCIITLQCRRWQKLPNSWNAFPATRLDENTLHFAISTCRTRNVCIVSSAIGEYSRLPRGDVVWTHIDKVLLALKQGCGVGWVSVEIIFHPDCAHQHRTYTFYLEMYVVVGTCCSQIISNK